jgi:transcriptional regulator with XRE-family HTH domain
MTPAEFKEARKRLGLSVEEMAEFLRLKDGRSVRRYEDGSREISGPIQVAIAYRLKYGPLP